MQLPRDIIDSLQPRMYALRHRQTDLLDQALHVHLLECAADDNVREESGGGEGHDKAGGDDGESAEEVDSVLVAAESGFARHDELREGSVRVASEAGGTDEGDSDGGHLTNE